MPRRNRYRVVGEWTQRQSSVAYDHNGVRLVSRIEEADLQEGEHGYRWAGGAQRVRFERDEAPNPRGRTFKGETAWSDAERYVMDIEMQHRLGRL